MALISARAAQVARVGEEYRGLDCLPHSCGCFQEPPPLVVTHRNGITQQLGFRGLHEVLEPVFQLVRVIPESGCPQAVGDQLHCIHVTAGFAGSGLVVDERCRSILDDRVHDTQ